MEWRPWQWWRKRAQPAETDLAVLTEAPPITISEHYKPFPRQTEFHSNTAKYRLFGGAAGPGKTKALLWEAIRQVNKWPRVDTLLLRRTFPELEASLITYFRRDVPPDLYRSYNEAKHIITWHNGSTTRFGYSASENDIYQYQGAEFLFIGVDELTLFTLGQWQFLTSRNRCPIKRATPNMAAATNPGNIGHAWVKALWVDRRPAPGMDRPGQYDAAAYAFIRATIADNPIYANDADYLKTLDALPHHLRQAFLEGDWNVFAGQYFDIFDVRQHTARAEQLGIAEFWPRWISIDWGYAHPSAVYWHAARPDGAVVTYREYVTHNVEPNILAREIAERSGDGCAGGERERIREVFLSPDAFAHHSSPDTIADQLGQVFVDCGLPQPVRADDDRVGGWMLMYQMLREGNWVIADSCRQLIECLPTLVRDPVNVEDVRKMDGDDPCLAPGTLVQCRRGLVPIESVKRGDFVLTRRGWREVLSSGMTAPHVKRVCLRLSDGGKIVGTPNHRIWLGGQWVRLDRAQHGDRLARCIRRRLSIKAGVTGAIRNLKYARTACTSLLPVSGAIGCCTAIFGRTLTDPSHLGVTSTTSIGIRSTTNSATSNVSLNESILPDILRRLKSWFLKARRVWSWREQGLLGGTNPKRGESLQGGFQPSSCASEESGKSVKSADNCFGACLGAVSARMRASLASGGRWVWITSERIASAAASVLFQINTTGYDFVPAHVLDVTEERPGPVYNLTIEGDHEFFANGILVHNCDSARYGLKSRLGAARPPVEQRLAERISAVDPTSRAIWMRKLMREEQRAAKPPVLPHRHGLQRW